MRTLLVIIALVVSGCSPDAALLIGAFAEGANQGLQTDYRHSAPVQQQTGGRHFTISRMGYIQSCYQFPNGDISCL